MKSYNKGEWSEPYLLLKLIVDQKLYLGKENFEMVENVFYPIVKILHSQKDAQTEFSFSGDIVVVKNEKDILRVPVYDFSEICKTTLNRINTVKSKKGSFAIPELIEFFDSLKIYEVKAKATAKNDITLQIQDPNTFLAPILGFSVKSQLGKASTLLNASGATNFIYKLTSKIEQSKIDEINNLRLFSDKFELFKNLGVDFVFEDVENEKFKINLQTIDYNFSKMLSDILLMYYRNSDASQNTIEKFVDKISAVNCFNYNMDLNPDIYQMIIKQFLVEYALGMTAAKIWKRDYKAEGGYLIVREDGEIICYHFYFVKNFENYLFQNTKLETPDRKRYKMAEVYEEDGIQKIKLNLQIRFVK